MMMHITTSSVSFDGSILSLRDSDYSVYGKGNISLYMCILVRRFNYKDLMKSCTTFHFIKILKEIEKSANKMNIYIFSFSFQQQTIHENKG